MEQKASPQINESLWIIKLNPVDWLTLSGLLFNGGAAVLILQQQFSLALSLMLIAMLADAFDGILARKFKLEREFGRYLDGFLDVFTYLALPALFLWQWCFNSSFYPAILIAFIGCGIVRLAVFNQIGNVSDEQDELSYLGMPVFWSLLFLAPAWLGSQLLPVEWIRDILAVILIGFSIAMLLNRRFKKFKNPKTIFATLLIMSLFFAIDGLISSGISSFSELVLLPVLLITPLIIAGSLHMQMVTNNHWSFLAIPLNRFLFGANKTLRGFIVMPFLALSTALLISPLLWLLEPDSTLSLPYYLAISCLFGFAYVAAELPNSFIKRRLGVAPGNLPEKGRTAFVIADQLDSALGVIFAGWLMGISAVTLLAMLISGPLIALLVKQLLFRIGWKATAR